MTVQIFLKIKGDGRDKLGHASSQDGNGLRSSIEFNLCQSTEVSSRNSIFGRNWQSSRLGGLVCSLLKFSAEKRKVARTSPWRKSKRAVWNGYLKLQFLQKAGLQGWLTKVTPGGASQPGKIHPVKEMPRLVEAKANAPEPTLKLLFRGKARLQEKVLQNEEMLFPRGAKTFCRAATDVQEGEHRFPLFQRPCSSCSNSDFGYR
jgi:hypothetical protein